MAPGSWKAPACPEFAPVSDHLTCSPDPALGSHFPVWGGCLLTKPWASHPGAKPTGCISGTDPAFSLLSHIEEGTPAPPPQFEWVLHSFHHLQVTTRYRAARDSLVAQLVKNPPAMQETLVDSWFGRSLGEGIGYPPQYSWASLVAQMVKNLPAMWETWVQSLGWEDPLEGMATHSSILGWRIPWTVKPGGLQSMGSQSQTQLSD